MPPLEASRPFPTIFVGSPMGFVFLGKSDQLPFFQNFHCGVKLLGACDNKAVVELHSFFLTNSCRLCPLLTTCASVATCSISVTSNLCSRMLTTCAPPHPTPPHPTTPHQHTLHNIEVYNRKKRQPFWGGESADSQKQLIIQHCVETPCSWSVHLKKPVESFFPHREETRMLWKYNMPSQFHGEILGKP